MNISGVQKYLKNSKPERFFPGIMVQHIFNLPGGYCECCTAPEVRDKSLGHFCLLKKFQSKPQCRAGYKLVSPINIYFCFCIYIKYRIKMETLHVQGILLRQLAYIVKITRIYIHFYYLLGHNDYLSTFYTLPSVLTVALFLTTGV